MAIKVGINGFGRIGRQSLKAMLDYYPQDIDVVAVNDLTDTTTNAHLFKYDSNYGMFPGEVSADSNAIIINGKRVTVVAEKDPAKIPWKELGAELVIESTGLFTDATKAKAHFEGGAKRIIISAPAKNEDITVVLGVNEGAYDPSKHYIISNASCTTNGLAPVAKVLNDRWGIEKGLLTTIHSYTGSQRLVDTASKDLRDARAAAMNIVPSSTGAARAVGLVMPELKGKFNGMSFRVPTPTVSVVDFTATLLKDTTIEELNAAFKEEAAGAFKGIIQYTEEPLVSMDLKGNPHSSIYSAMDTLVVGGNMVKIIAWYDNEWGYSCRVADITAYIGKKGL